MSVQVENLEKNTAKLTIEVPAEKFDAAVKNAYNKSKSRFNIPGFRKGKAPFNMIKKMYGVGVFYEDAVDEVIDASYPDAAKESGLEIVSRPSISIEEIEEGKAFVYTAVVAVKPEVTLGEYKGMEVDKTSTRVTQKEVEANMREDGEAAALEVGIHGIHPELVKLLGRMKFRTSYGQNALKHSIEVAQLSGLLAAEVGVDIRMAKRAGLLHDIGKSIDHEVEGSHVKLGAELCRKYKESPIVINAVESHHGDVEPESLIACIVQAADTISAARPGARRETLETYTNRLKQLEEITDSFKGVDKSFAIQAGREVRVMVVPEQINDDDMVLLARNISKKIEESMEYPGQIRVNVIRESRVTDYAK